MPNGDDTAPLEGTDEGTAATASREDASQETGGQRKKTKAFARRVLVVDDSRDARESMATLLRELGYLVLTAQDGESALERAAAFKPHVMLLDIVMPGMSGFKVAEKVRANELLRDTLLITLTGWSYDVDGWLSKNAGCDYHLLKPLDPYVLESLLRQGRPRRKVGEA